MWVLAVARILLVVLALRGNCRLRDLIPDSAGIALGAGVLVLLDGALRRMPALLRSRPSMI